jgi:hypothetical protein
MCSCRRCLPIALAGLFAAGAALATTHAGTSNASPTSNRPAVSRSGPDSPAVEQMMRADVNRDGMVTRDELERLDSRLVPLFEAADADGDGKLTLREFERLRELSRGATPGAAAGGSAAGAGPRNSRR